VIGPGREHIDDYEDWAAERTQRQLAKAGFRLGMMLRAIYE